MEKFITKINNSYLDYNGKQTESIRMQTLWKDSQISRRNEEACCRCAS